MCTRATAPLCVYPCFCYRGCRRRSCQCGLHKQAARAKVARSSAQPKGLRSASRRQSRRSCSASRPGRRARSRPHRTARRRPVRLAPSSGSPAGGSASAATGACCAVTLRTAPSPLRSLALPPRSFRGLRKPRSGSCSAGDEKNEKNVPVSIQLSHISHPCLRIQLATEFMALPGGYYMPNSREGRGRYGQIDSGLGQGSWPELPRDEYLA